MKKIIAATLAVYGALVATQSVQSRNVAKDSATTQQHHSGDGSVLLIGDYTAFCFFQFPGAGLADMRNINVNGHTQQVVHLRAQGGGANAQAFVNNLDKVATTITSPISFTVVKGNARRLLTVVKYIPHGETETVSQSFVTPDAIAKEEGELLLIANGNGSYSIPLGNGGIPQGSQLTYFQFLQLGASDNCNKHVSNINHLQINRRFVGISADPSDSCEHNCVDDTGAEE
jgi:hypothetical protein